MSTPNKTSEMTPEQAYENAVAQQINAADPTRDVFVSANAGSGKTHVLVNRVSRLLLSAGGLPPDKILCLTYTKAAASEMQTRLFKTLGKWSILETDDLKDELTKLLGPEASADIDLSLARRLFAKALETPEGLKVQTIHAFCERILSRFPIEAGILPGFDALDDAQARRLQAEVWEQILSEAYEEPASELAWAIDEVMSTTANMTLESLRSWMGHNIYKIMAWETAGGTANLANDLGVNAQMSTDSVRREAWAAVSKDNLKAAIAGLRQSKSAAQARYADQFEALLSEPDGAKAYARYAEIILKKDNQPRAQIGIRDSGDAAHAFFGEPKCADTPEMQAVADTQVRLQGVTILTATRAIFEIARNFAHRYQAIKRERRALDFADQIMLTRDLLRKSYVSDWVRYKLDGGVEHILVDEAQDTSQAQWDIVDVFRDMFTHDQDRHTPYPRTMFAVGDEKQSIYSFQGADPELFITRTKHESAQSAFSGIRMRMSFRSSPDILRFVDQIFVDDHGLQNMFSSEVAPPASDLLRHTAKRNAPGYVEFWPLSPAPERTDGEEPWKPEPLDAVAADSSREALAREIAKQIHDWIKNKEPVAIIKKMPSGPDQEIVRPVEAGDILILVRRRTGPFFNAVIRNLKQCGVAVAGADRLVLSDSIAVQDLMSIARFCCLPSDDLALAEVLKGPLFSFTEQQLFDIAYVEGGRKTSLWAALRAQHSVAAQQAAERLQHILEMSHRRAPYEFFEGILSTPLRDGTSQLKLFYKRLSMEVADPIEAFLSRALAHQREEAPSLQHFVQSFISDRTELKREFDGRQNEVRVMTVYGAKGLEAPIVILPDTSQLPDAKNALDNGMLARPDKTFVKLGRKDVTPPNLLAQKELRVQKLTQEYLRLFYVALTRAKTRLLICGYFSGTRPKNGAAQKAPEGCWHDLAQKALEGLEAREIVTPFDSDAYKGYAYGTRPEQKTDEAKATETKATHLPNWAANAIPPKDAPQKQDVFSPSTLLARGENLSVPARSPISQSPERFLRGNLIHKLLELLPDLPPKRRDQATDNFLSGYTSLSVEDKNDIAAVVARVLNHPDFAPIFAPGSHAEISMAGQADGLPKSLRLNAQIDRLCVTDTQVFIVDYKSNRPPPDSPDKVSKLYLGQMAAYRELAKSAYPGREITCALLWTENAQMMTLPDNLLDEALEIIRKDYSPT